MIKLAILLIAVIIATTSCFSTKSMENAVNVVYEIECESCRVLYDGEMNLNIEKGVNGKWSTQFIANSMDSLKLSITTEKATRVKYKVLINGDVIEAKDEIVEGRGLYYKADVATYR